PRRGGDAWCRLHPLGDSDCDARPRARPRGCGSPRRRRRGRGRPERPFRPRCRGRARRRDRARPQPMEMSELGEFGLLAELERRGLAVRIEDDVAQLGGGLVVTQDALVEGVHFGLDRLPWQELGFRAAAVNLSDLAAAGAVPEALAVTLALPGET